jgi:hypothetical protein
MSYIIGVLKRNDRQNRQTYTKKERRELTTHTQAYKEEEEEK